MMWPFNGKRAEAPKRALAPLFLFNTLCREKQEFTLPAIASTVRMYNCGPTVYNRQHIGNLSMFVFADILRRTLEYNGFAVKQVINITDVGHLTSDADDGEDKMSKGLKREKMKVNLENMLLLAEKYTKIFLEDIRQLNIDTDRIEFPRASAHIPAQIAMIQTLMDKSYAYVTTDGVYFDTKHFAHYGALGGIDVGGLKEGARVAANPEKRHPTDFALWKFNKKMGWDSPWGKGFPGWHIECSAMIRRTLGEQIDIHTGGIEHIPVHHNNEIAQSEGATGKKPLSRFWLHRAHIQIDGGKIAKSSGKVLYLSDILEKGFHPLSLRYLFLGAHYRTAANFSWEALSAAQTAYGRLVATVRDMKSVGDGSLPSSWYSKFSDRINDDLDTPGALGVIWEMLRDTSIPPEDKRSMILSADRVFGLQLAAPDAGALALAEKETQSRLVADDVPPAVQELVKRREDARMNKKWTEADTLRDEIEVYGFGLDDTPTGTRLYKKD